MKRGLIKKQVGFAGVALMAAFNLIFLISCSEFKKPETKVFYGQNIPLARQEFRWSNGKMPKSFDPALASASPEADIARAIYEGVTSSDPKSLVAIPAAAERWESSDDKKIWKFYIRSDALWSNGKNVRAKDFVRAWNRLAKTGPGSPVYQLIKNIAGNGQAANDADANFETEIDAFRNEILPEGGKPGESAAKSEAGLERRPGGFGATAISDSILQVRLARPDENLPLLLSHPVFSPVFNQDDFGKDPLNGAVPTNGPFRIASVGAEGITLDKADFYWNREAITLERVRFVPKEDGESALQAYKSGDLDAVTNAAFEPLAIKLLSPFRDVRQTTHSALNYYEFNLERPPFNDVRVRQALAISIERERLTEDEMNGATEPAFLFTPFSKAQKLIQDQAEARKLLGEAGFPNGDNFPNVQLVVNRNDMQKRIARAIAKMWKKNLNIDATIIVKERWEIDAAREKGEFDLIRRGVVLPTADETSNMLAIFSERPKLMPEKGMQSKTAAIENAVVREIGEEAIQGEPGNEGVIKGGSPLPGEGISGVITEEEAIRELPAIPLYFPKSFSLVKPYVKGFETNSFDAHSLKDVAIEGNWQQLEKPLSGAGQQR